jgi:hypothetical protein
VKTLSSILSVLLLGTVAQARLVENWPYDKLTAQADLIVIATPTAVRDTAERTTFPNLVNVDTNNIRSPVSAIGVETTFETLAVLKGSTNTTTFVFHHLRDAILDSPVGHSQVISFNGPVNVAFDPSEKVRYLLFLKRESDGRYASVTGLTDPIDGIKDLGKFP